MRYFLVILFLIPFFTKAQLVEDIKKSFSVKPKLLLSLGSRDAIVSNTYAKMRHVLVGANYNNVSKVGLTFNWQAKGVYSDYWLDDDTKLQKQLKIFYIAPYFNYTFYQTEKFEASIPVQIGFGPSYYQYKLCNGEKVNMNKGFNVLYEPAMTATYKPIKYIGLGGGIGYRVPLIKNKKIEEKLLAPYLMWWVKIYFGTFYKDKIKDKFE